MTAHLLSKSAPLPACCGWRRLLRSWLLLLVAFLPLTASAQSPLDGIAPATDEHGHKVFVNAPKTREDAVAQPVRRSVLVYWSNQEGRWKSVPPPSPATMRAARRAANEVASYVRSQPESTQVATISPVIPAPATSFTRTAKASPHASASNDPNYSALARGRWISATEIDSAIDKAAKRHGVDPNLVRAVIKVESNFDPRAVSRKGAMGLMQLMPDTARKLNVDNPFDPQQNVDAGVRHLKNLLTSYHGDVRLTLAAYNAGEMAVARAGGVPNFPETRNYVQQITQRYRNGPSSGPAGIVRPGAEPIRVFRNGQGVLTITNE